jgi:hypothetical protein
MLSRLDLGEVDVVLSGNPAARLGEQLAKLWSVLFFSHTVVDEAGCEAGGCRLKIPLSIRLAFVECKFGRLVDSLPEVMTGSMNASVLLFCYAASGTSCLLSMVLLRMVGDGAPAVSLTHVAPPEATSQRSAVTALAKDLFDLLGLEVTVSEIGISSIDESGSSVPSLLASLPIVVGEQSPWTCSCDYWDHQATAVWTFIRGGPLRPLLTAADPAIERSVGASVVSAVYTCLAVVRDRCAIPLQDELSQSSEAVQGMIEPLRDRVTAVVDNLSSFQRISSEDVEAQLASTFIAGDPIQRMRLAQMLWKVFYSHPHLSFSISSLQSRLAADIPHEKVEVSTA